MAQRGSLFSRNGRHFAEKVRRFFFARSSFWRIPLRRREEKGRGGVGKRPAERRVFECETAE